MNPELFRTVTVSRNARRARAQGTKQVAGQKTDTSQLLKAQGGYTGMGLIFPLGNTAERARVRVRGLTTASEHFLDTPLV